MVKESILFVTATSLFVYFIMPAAQPAQVKVEAPQEDIQAPVAKKIPPANDGWSYGDSDSDETPFVFGEPVTHSDSDYEVTTSNIEENTNPGPSKESVSPGPSRSPSASPSVDTRPRIPPPRILD